VRFNIVNRPDQQVPRFDLLGRMHCTSFGILYSPHDTTVRARRELNAGAPRSGAKVCNRAIEQVRIDVAILQERPSRSA